MHLSVMKWLSCDTIGIFCQNIGILKEKGRIIYLHLVSWKHTEHLGHDDSGLFLMNDSFQLQSIVFPTKVNGI